jgi:uncharacterized protein YlxW (UPF0749 family)
MAGSISKSTFQPPPLTNETIQARLETGAHGSRASLTKCALRYRALLEATREEPPNPQAVEEAKSLLDTELQLYKVEFTKLVLKVTAIQQDLENLQQTSLELQSQIAAKKTLVQSLRQDVVKSKKVDGYKEEYEALAKMANHRPSRAILEKRLLLAQKQMQVAISTEQSLQEELDIRQAQFNTLMQCMLDLKASVQQENTSTTEDEKEEKDGGDESEEEEGAVPMDTT